MPSTLGGSFVSETFWHKGDVARMMTLVGVAMVGAVGLVDIVCSAAEVGETSAVVAGAVVVVEVVAGTSTCP